MALIILLVEKRLAGKADARSRASVIHFSSAHVET